MPASEKTITPTPSTNADQSSGTGTAVQTKPAVQTRRVNQTKPLPAFNVILLDDDDHSYEYVIQMLRRVCGHPDERGFQLAKQVDTSGRAIVMTTHKELAELKRDQIMGFGADPRMNTSRGSMSAVIEPAQ